MKKIKNKSFHDLQAIKKNEHNLKRQGKIHTNNYNVNQAPQTFSFNSQKKSKTKTIIVPPEFSLVSHPEDALKFFEHFYDVIHRETKMLIIDMRYVKTMTFEVLLYLISLQRINKEAGLPTSITVRAPKDPALQYLMAQSGFGKYFKANIETTLKDGEIFTIRDGMSNKEKNIDDAQTCADAIDFALKFHPNKTKKDHEFRRMYNALAEMMTNTDNHAYNSEIFRNWYLFAAKVENGISYYFFDNGQGIIKTAKKNMIETAIDYSFSLGHRSLMKSVLNGEYRSATGKAYRNKGLPEINDFLIEEEVGHSVILTNRLFCLPREAQCLKSEYEFRGTLFAWIFKDDEEE